MQITFDGHDYTFNEEDWTITDSTGEAVAQLEEDEISEYYYVRNLETDELIGCSHINHFEDLTQAVDWAIGHYSNF